MRQITLENYVVRLIDNPNESLSTAERDELVQACSPVARKGFNNDGITANDIKIHALDVTTGIYISDKTGKVIGFGGTTQEIIDDKIVLHLKGTAIMPEHQSKGLYHLITPLRALSEAQKIGPQVYIGTRTQNPRVFEFMSGQLRFYPQVKGENPEQISAIAEKYAKIVQDKHSDFHPKEFVFDKFSMVVRRAYGGTNPDRSEFGFCMYGDNIPIARSKEHTQYMNQKLDFKNGDALILIGEFSKEAYLNVLKSVSQKFDAENKMHEIFRKL